MGVPSCCDGLREGGQDLHSLPVPLRPVHLRVQVGQPIYISGRTSAFLSSLGIRNFFSEALWKQTTIEKVFFSRTFFNGSRPTYSEATLKRENLV